MGVDTQQRANKLGGMFKQYATQFLGVECNLETIQMKADFVDLNLFVPKFDDKVRTSPDQCSEAQRFFLDIAFRMSLIEFSSNLSNHPGSFICETPENALDLTYVNNVARMFRSFSEKGHHLIATSNIQKGGIAGPMLSDLSVNEKENSVLNMIKKARLTKVQEDSKPLLLKEIKDIIG